MGGVYSLGFEQAPFSKVPAQTLSPPWNTARGRLLDLQCRLQTAFHAWCEDSDRLETAMENDPDTVAKRAEIQSSLKRLQDSMRKLSTCN